MQKSKTTHITPKKTPQLVMKPNHRSLFARTRKLETYFWRRQKQRRVEELRWAESRRKGQVRRRGGWRGRER